MNLLRLGSLLGDRSYDEKAVETCRAFGEELGDQPWTFPSMLTSVVGCLNGMKQIVLVGKKEDEITTNFMQNMWGRFMVNSVAIHVDPEEPEDWIISRNDVLLEVLKIPSDGRPFITICEGYTCGLPIRDINSVSQELK